MSSALFTQQLKEARRDALVSHYIANHDFSGCHGNINNANDLYEYLLLDTKISDHVITTPLSEGINSLQLAIHRAMEGYDGNLATTAQSWFAEDAFLANWDRYNKRYSTWAGKEKLRFYAGNYINPSLRPGKSRLFVEFENEISQGALSESSVSSAILKYLVTYGSLSRLNYIAVNSCTNEQDIFFIGQTKEIPHQHYWRKLYLKSKDNDTSTSPLEWTEWLSIPIDITPSNIKTLRAIYVNNNMGVMWRENIKEQGEGSNVIISNNIRYLLLSSDSTWREEIVDFRDFLEISSDESYSISSELKIVVEHRFSVTLNPFEEQLHINDISPGRDSSSLKINGVEVKAGEKVSVNIEAGINIHHSDRSYHGVPSNSITTINGKLSYGKISEDGFFYIPPTKSNISENIALKLQSNIDLSHAFRLNKASIFDYTLQKELADITLWHPREFAYSQYLWEIFFHVPFLIATRFATEQRFEEAYTWYKYIFNSAGYRDADGKLLLDDAGSPRYWNCYPLQHDTGWDSELLPSSDPDAIAMADPMHYKLAIFLHTLDLLITRGDTLYRQLERDTLAEAKMYYMQAQQLLGPRPDIRLTNSWANPTLSAEAGNITTPLAAGEPVTFAQWLRAGDAHDMGDGHFLPPYNDALLAYWDKLELRLYNLRHNLSLNGQPLSLRLYATPVDPAELHRQQSGGDGPQGEVAPSNRVATGWRYPLLSEFARSAVSQLMQFGSSLQNALERQDNERMTLLLQTQQVSVLGQQQEVAQKNLDSLTASLKALRVSHETATLHKTHYDNLLNGGLSAGEIAALTLRSTSMASNLVSIGTAIAGGALSALPNTFGLANGGGDFGAPLHAATQVTQTLAHTLDQAATISDITAGYQRRAEEWMLQRNSAEKEQAQLTAQIDSLQQQIVMAQKQMALNELEAANAQEQYELQVSRFTGQALYNWLAGRLSALYYQQYDATLPVCLQARAALEQELGKGLTDKLFRTPVWDDLWQGLLAGEGLNVELQKLSNIWLENSAKGLEATRTVSLAAQREEPSGSLRMAIGQILADGPDTPTRGVALKLNGDGMFIAELTLAELGLGKSYNMDHPAKTRFVKNIAVTLPTLLGPYQDIEATLQLGDEIATLSHGMNDSGRFVTNFESSQFLPFEGADPTTGTLTLTLFNVKKDGAPAAQYATVENLSDIIFHIHYILRDKA